jgi:serine/threonine protein kinase
MEYFERGSLAAPSAPALPPETRRAIADAARGAHALHEAGLVHRNIKPGNIMLGPNAAKLGDLGLAHVIAPGLTMTSIGRIDPIEYLDPGILAHRHRPSRASDIWSLGVTLHRGLTGVGIYGDLPDSDPLFAIRAVMNEEPTVDPSLDAADREIVTQCLAIDPRERPPTALEVAERLEQLDGVDRSEAARQ